MTEHTLHGFDGHNWLELPIVQRLCNEFRCSFGAETARAALTVVQLQTHLRPTHKQHTNNRLLNLAATWRRPRSFK